MREFSVKDCNNLVNRVNRKSKAIAKGGLSTTREKRRKGYAATREDFLHSTEEEGNNEGPVFIPEKPSQDGGVAMIIWKHGVLCEQLQESSKQIKTFLGGLLGLPSAEQSSFCKFDFDKGERGLDQFSQAQKTVISNCIHSVKEDLEKQKKLAPGQQPDETPATDPDSDISKAVEETNKAPLPDAPIDDDFDSNDLHNKLMAKLSAILELKADDMFWCGKLMADVSEAMDLMTMKKREAGSNSDELKLKSLKQRWFSKHPATKSTKKATTQEGGESKEEEMTVVDRGTIVTLKDADGEFKVLGVFNKFYNKWFLRNQSDKKALGLEQQKGDKKKGAPVRLHVRKVAHNPASTLRTLVEVGEGVSVDDAFKQIAFNDIDEVKGKLSGDLS